MKLYSHPRSGTNWIRALLCYAIYGEMKLAVSRTGHWSQRRDIRVSEKQVFGGHVFYDPTLPKRKVYLFRDGRDVALSMWKAKSLQHKNDADLTFSQFIRKPLDWYGTPGKKLESGLNIIQHWKRHLGSWRRAPDTYFLRYENVLLHRRKEITKIAKFAGFKIRRLPRMGAMGPDPSTNYRASKWKDAYSKKDLDYFYRIVPKNHWGLYNDHSL